MDGFWRLGISPCRGGINRLDLLVLLLLLLLFAFLIILI